jgi:hypothetical protein
MNAIQVVWALLGLRTSPTGEGLTKHAISIISPLALTLTFLYCRPDARRRTVEQQGGGRRIGSSRENAYIRDTWSVRT